MSQVISAVALVVPDYDAALDFYVDALGFDLIEDTALSATRRWVLIAPPGGCPGTRLLIAKADGPGQSRAIGQQAGDRVAFILTTDDFDADHRRMSAAGAIFEEMPRHEPYGTVAVWRDPFGNRWDLLEPA